MMTVEFTITNRKGQSFKCCVDEQDADLLDGCWHVLTWVKSHTVYLKRMTPRPNQRTEAMHRIILGRVLGRPLERHEEVDHVDRNGLNNTRSNLRLATRIQNMANTKIKSNSTTGFKGVSKMRGRYRAMIRVNGKTISLGGFDTKEEAHAAYLEAAIKYHGEFARGE